MFNRRRSNMFHSHFYIFYFYFIFYRRDVEYQFDVLTSVQRIEPVSITNQPESRPSFFVFIRLLSDRFLEYFRLVNIELSQCVVYFLLMVNTDLPRREIFHDSVNSHVEYFHSCFFLFFFF